MCDGRTCIGHLLPHGKLGFEAFDSDQRSLGTFATMREAADAICAVPITDITAPVEEDVVLGTTAKGAAA